MRITMVVMMRTPGMMARPSSTPFFPPSRMALRKRMKMLSLGAAGAWAFSSITSGASSTAGESISGQVLRQLRCMSRVDMMDPQNAPTKPTMAPPPCPRETMVISTTNPIPKAVPKLVRDTSWYFLKKDAKDLSLAKAMMAGLSERKVISAPRAAAPGRLKRGFISSLSPFSSILTTPNSVRSLESAPVRTVMPIR